MRRWMFLCPLFATPACGPGRVLDSATTGDTSSTSGSAMASDTTGGPPTTAATTTEPTSTSEVPGSSTGSAGLTTGTATPDSTSGTTGSLPDATSGGTTTTTDTGETGTSSSTGGIDFMCITGGDTPAPNDPDPCACIVDQEPGPLDPMAPTCGEDSCDKVLAADMGNELLNPAALQCTLEALRDRKPGLLRYDVDTDSDYAEDAGYILILDDGTAIVRRWGHEDLTFWVGNAVHVELPDPCAFEQCLAEPFAWKRIECLSEFPYQELGVCDEGWGGDL